MIGYPPPSAFDSKKRKSFRRKFDGFHSVVGIGSRRSSNRKNCSLIDLFQFPWMAFGHKLDLLPWVFSGKSIVTSKWSINLRILNGKHTEIIILYAIYFATQTNNSTTRILLSTIFIAFLRRCAMANDAWGWGDEWKKKCSLWRRRRFENAQALQSVNHNRFQITRAMQLYFYWFLPELGWHMSFHCGFCAELNGDRSQATIDSVWHFGFCLFLRVSATRRKMKRRWNEEISSHRHHTPVCAIFAVSVFRSSRRPPSQIGKFKPIVSRDRKLLFLFVWHKKRNEMICAILAPWWSICVFVYKHFHIFDFL